MASSIADYDRFVGDLLNEIDANPDKKYRIILKAIKETECPFLRKRLRGYFQ